MQYSQEIYRLALKNVALIEKAVTVLYDVDKRVISSIHKYIYEYVQKAEEDFYAFATYEDEAYISFLKNEWKEGNDKEWKTSFQFCGEGKDFDDAWWVSLLMGRVAGTLTGFYFYINGKQIRGNERSQWKECVQRAFTENELGKDGFKLNGDGMAILYPVSFEMSDLLAMLPEKEGEGLPKDAPCFANIKKALDKIVEKIAVFDGLAQKALDLNG